MKYIRKELAEELRLYIENNFPNTRFAYKKNATEKYPLHIRLFIFFISIFAGVEYFSHYFMGWIILPDENEYKVNWNALPFNVYKIVTHELVHARQEKENKYWAIRYLFCPFPFFWTERAKWEMEAYKVSLQANYRAYGRVSESLSEYYVELFVSAAYMYMSAPWHRREIKREFVNYIRDLNNGDIDFEIT